MASPKYSRAEVIADGCVHVVGITSSLVAMTVLVVLAQMHLPAASAASLTIYGFCAVAMFVLSAAYNLVSRPRWKDILRKFDHSAIFVMIAGTYTPFALIEIGGSSGALLLIVVWAIAISGIALKFALPQRFDQISIGLYLLQGWVVLTAIEPLILAVTPRVLVLLVLGGILYTVGVVFHLWQRMPYQNAVWHIFVLCAAACHYAAIVFAVAPEFGSA